MPLNVRGFFTSVLLIFVSFGLIAHSQTVAPPAPTIPPSLGPQTPTSGDVMRDRISKAKAFIVVRNYNAAIYELENIRKETSDSSVQGVVNVLLMNSYLEQGDYRRAQDFLNELYTKQKTTKANASELYKAVAGQVVKGARSRVERYRSLGLSVADRTLPLEALNDLEKMRETLEIVITQSKELGADKVKSGDAFVMLEEASSSRGMLARDDYDARHWKDEVADTREAVASSRSVVTSAVNDTPAETLNTTTVAASVKPADTPTVMPQVIEPKSSVTRDREIKPMEIIAAKIETPAPVKSEPKPDVKIVEASKTGTPLDVGSLVGYATRQTSPVYPPAAKTARATGVVKVEVTIDESGAVSEVQKTSGPSMLQNAAKDAIRKWKFRPFVRDGQPVKANGYVSFNFAL